MFDCVGFKMVYCNDKGEGKDKVYYMFIVRFFRGNSDFFYLLDN